MIDKNIIILFEPNLKKCEKRVAAVLFNNGFNLLFERYGRVSVAM